MIIQPGPSKPISFTDETSPRLLNSSDRKVSIHGQVIRQPLPYWFYDLSKLYPNEKEEVKSEKVLAEFHNLPQEFRSKVWAGMKQVIINIVDSLSYQVRLEKSLRKAMKHDKAYDMLKAHASQGNKSAKKLLKMMDESVTELIVSDSPPERLKYLMRNRRRYGGHSLAAYMRNDYIVVEKTDISPFRTKTSSMSGKAVKWASKSGSVFFRAIDEVTKLDIYLEDGWIHYHSMRHLQPSHAFDRGDDQAINWIDSQRHEIVRRMNPFQYEIARHTLQPLEGKIASEDSFYTQAADIAAGFARQLYERHGIVAVASSFEYVTLNGEWITQNNAEERFRYWKQIAANN